MNTGQSGFTLIETLIVIALIASVAALGFLSTRPSSSTGARVQASLILDGIEHARQEAIVTQAPTALYWRNASLSRLHWSSTLAMWEESAAPSAKSIDAIEKIDFDERDKIGLLLEPSTLGNVERTKSEAGEILAILYPSGLAAPSTIHLSTDKDERISLHIQANGSASLSP